MTNETADDTATTSYNIADYVIFEYEVELFPRKINLLKVKVAQLALWQ